MPIRNATLTSAHGHSRESQRRGRSRLRAGSPEHTEPKQYNTALSQLTEPETPSRLWTAIVALFCSRSRQDGGETVRDATRLASRLQSTFHNPPNRGAQREPFSFRPRASLHTCLSAKIATARIKTAAPIRGSRGPFTAPHFYLST